MTQVSTLSRIRKISLYVCIAGLLWFVVHVVAIVWDGLSDELHKADVAVVFGNQVHRDGTPSTRLKMRLDRTIQLYRDGSFGHIFVSGGVGVEGQDEAKVMKRYLISHGVPAKAILVDSHGMNTYKTCLHTHRLLTRKGWRSVLLISQYFHISRAKLASHRFGIKEVYSAHAVIHFEWRELYSIFREFVGFYAYLLKSYKVGP